MRNVRWTPEDDAVLLLETAEDIPYSRIAEHLDRTHTAVMQRASTPLHAHVWNGGDGGALSVDMLLVGPAVAEVHGQWL